MNKKEIEFTVGGLYIPNVGTPEEGQLMFLETGVADSLINQGIAKEVTAKAKPKTKEG